jgi:hypothetical protein
VNAERLPVAGDGQLVSAKWRGDTQARLIYPRRPHGCIMCWVAHGVSRLWSLPIESSCNKRRKLIEPYRV